MINFSQFRHPKNGKDSIFQMLFVVEMTNHGVVLAFRQATNTILHWVFRVEAQCQPVQMPNSKESLVTHSLRSHFYQIKLWRYSVGFLFVHFEINSDFQIWFIRFIQRWSECCLKGLRVDLFFWLMMDGIALNKFETNFLTEKKTSYFLWWSWHLRKLRIFPGISSTFGNAADTHDANKCNYW